MKKLIFCKNFLEKFTIFFVNFSCFAIFSIQGKNYKNFSFFKKFCFQDIFIFLLLKNIFAKFLEKIIIREIKNSKIKSLSIFLIFKNFLKKKKISLRSFAVAQDNGKDARLSLSKPQIKIPYIF